MKNGCPLLTYELMVFPSVGALEPCKTATAVDDITRSASRVLVISGKEKCDRTMDGWFRFKINNKDADMPTSCIDVFRCGSSKPIWLNAINITFSVIPDVTPIEPEHNVAVAYKDDHMLKFRCNIQIPVANRGHVFDLKWDLNGRSIFPISKNIKEEDFHKKAVLTANDLKREKQKTIGFKLKCSVRARAVPNSVPTIFIESREFYAGIMVNTSTLIVNAGETAYVQIRSTVPITCSNFNIRKLECYIRFEMLDYKSEIMSTSHAQFCQTQKRTQASRLCGVYFNARKWSTFQTLIIPTKSDQHIRDKYTAIVRLKSVGINSDDLWLGYILPDIRVKWLCGALTLDSCLIPIDLSRNDFKSLKKIRIRGGKFIPASCTSVTDHHITTFDGRYFTTFETGEYVLYKHLQKPVAVHVIHKSHGSSPRWNCAVAVQAGADTFIVYGCDRRWRHRRAFCDKIHGSYLDVYERNQGKDFEVHLPTGARVLIKVRGYSHSGIYDRYIDVQIFASTLDEKFTGGLCGMFNRNVNNDFADPNGRVVNEDKFKKSWHVDPDDSLFIARAHKEILQRSQYICSCIHYSTPNPNGDLDSTADCNWDDSTPVCTAPTYSEQQCQYKHRREAQDVMEIDIPEDIVIFKPAPPDSNKWKNGWNETAAKNHCKTVLHNSQIYKQCKNLVHFNETQAIQMCVEDIKFLGSSNLSAQVDKPLRDACINIARLNTTLWSDNNSSISTGVSTTSLTTSILVNDCPGDCSEGREKRGTCTNGNCTCFSRYIGDDCSIDTQKAPAIEANDEDTLCDTAMRGCSYVNVYGENFNNRGSAFKCRLEEKQVTNKTNENISKLHMTEQSLFLSVKSDVNCHMEQTEDVVIFQSPNRQDILSQSQPMEICTATKFQLSFSIHPAHSVSSLKEPLPVHKRFIFHYNATHL
ncbi:unnamed protein product [Mytilus coruscus]|uniref:VWFD domain-containing protein n=1 Tax=Mytilus coruscus TaxID=42192 RepID=A0A6J7ZZ82_MYTCO|nr:unnamed protein product [Mytilus coruscus]